jgi:predicted nucleic acid-binding protein
MHTLVLDSSVIVKWLIHEDELNTDTADKIINQSLDGEVELIAPELSKYEIGNVLVKKKIDPDDAKIALSTLYSLPITYITESIEMAEQTYSLASSLGITYYDATFLSLAKHYNAPLVTENIKHQGRSSDINVIPLKDY